MNLREFDIQYRKAVLGVDEAGRGPLAGPVVAGAVLIPEYFSELEEINDSKKLSEAKRRKLFEIINEKCIVGIGIADEKEIDSLNILNATFLAMRRAIGDINEKIGKRNADGEDIGYGITLVDGNHKIRGYSEPQECIIKGDAKSLSIAAASIVAKVSRDSILLKISEEFPEYRFEKHKGYGTRQHREILLEKGACRYHRRSFLTKILKDAEKKGGKSEGEKLEGKREMRLF